MVHRAIRDFESAGGCTPSESEIGKALDIPPEQVHEALAFLANRKVSLDYETPVGALHQRVGEVDHGYTLIELETTIRDVLDGEQLGADLVIQTLLHDCDISESASRVGISVDEANEHMAKALSRLATCPVFHRSG